MPIILGLCMQWRLIRWALLVGVIATPSVEISMEFVNKRNYVSTKNLKIKSTPDLRKNPQLCVVRNSKFILAQFYRENHPKEFFCFLFTSFLFLQLERLTRTLKC